MEDFLEQLRNDHNEFDRGALEGYFGAAPFDLFKTWYQDAFESKVNEPNAFALATVSETGRPSSRILYLKELLEEEFIFYTNYASQKGREIELNPNASMLFFWPELQRQIRIEGVVKRVEPAVSDAYFASRPRGSQIGAWASEQSALLDDRKTLEDRVEAFAIQFPEEVKRPPHWGGYALIPDHVEFWQGRPSRLHDRIVYTKRDQHWEIYRKNP